MQQLCFDWQEVIAGGLHPSVTSPRGCKLQQLTLTHPEPIAVAGALARVGLTEVVVAQGVDPHIGLLLETPRGFVDLGSVDFDAESPPGRAIVG